MQFERFSDSGAVGERQSSAQLFSQASDSLNAKSFSALRADAFSRSSTESYLPQLKLVDNETFNAGLGRSSDRTRSQTRQPGETNGEQRSSGRTSNQNPWSNPRDGQPVPHRQPERPKSEPPADGSKAAPGDVHKVKPEQPSEANKDKPKHDRPAERKGEDQKPGDKKPQSEIEVKKGDTLWAIAKKLMNAENPNHPPSPKEIFKMIYEIAKLNGVHDIDKIQPGQKLKIPKH